MKTKTNNIKLFILVGFLLLSSFHFDSAFASVTSATGGSITTSGGYTIHTFTTSGTFTVVSGSGNVEYLIVGGGAGGSAGGGGAGAMRTSSTYAVTPQAYTVTVGAGGSAGDTNVSNGSNGGNSSFDGVVSLGGGGGGLGGITPGSNGGSGGGGGSSSTTNNAGGTGSTGGNAGGSNVYLSSPYPSGGGGGAGATGSNSPSGSVSGAGGVGLASSISGASVFYSGGGGGGMYVTGTGGAGGNGGGGAGSNGSGSGVAGTANTGGGGGGGRSVGSTAGDGGSGIVIVRYLTSGSASPNAVEDLTSPSQTKTTIDLDWTLPSLNGGVFEGYQINSTTPFGTPLTIFTNNTLSSSTSATISGLIAGTQYSFRVSPWTDGGNNATGNIINVVTNSFDPPGTPVLSADALSDTALRFTSVAGIAGDNPTIYYGLRCELNGSGGWLNSVSNSSYVSSYEYTGLTLGDSLVCQWKDGSIDGWSSWSNNATDTLELAILSAQRGINNTDDKLMQFIEMVSGMGGVYFGLGVLPFGLMLIGFMAGKKTVRIFTLATLMLMGMVHASGYYVYPNWYWTIALLLGLVLIMGRMKSD